MLPGQLPSRRAADTDAEHCRSLYCAVLVAALEDLGSRNRTVRTDAARWFKYTYLGSPVSLRSCCQALDLNPQRIGRHALRSAGLR